MLDLWIYVYHVEYPYFYSKSFRHVISIYKYAANIFSSVFHEVWFFDILCETFIMVNVFPPRSSICTQGAQNFNFLGGGEK